MIACDVSPVAMFGIGIQIRGTTMRKLRSWAGYDEYSLLYSTRDFFSLLVPYSEILLLGRVASNGNGSSNVSKLGLDNKSVSFLSIIQILFVSWNDTFGFERLVLVYFWKCGGSFPIRSYFKFRGSSQGQPDTGVPHVHNKSHMGTNLTTAVYDQRPCLTNWAILNNKNIKNKNQHIYWNDDMKIQYKVFWLALPTLLEITRLMKKKSLPYSKLLE